MLLNKILHKIFGSPHDRRVKRMQPVIDKIHEFRANLLDLDDAELCQKTIELRNKLKAGQTLADILPESFAVSQEACDRRMGMFNVVYESFEFDLHKLSPQIQNCVLKAREELAAGKPEHLIHLPADFYKAIRALYPESVKPFRMLCFDVQLMGGIVLYEGTIAEMQTGEGKTLAAANPMYLIALEGKGAHVVTVNDYLASRDAEFMSKAYCFLGMEVGLIVHGISSEQRRAAYHSDVTYGTNNEFGFDYLRDNMATSKEDLVQRDLHYCIVDEVDSVLVDEARTPLIISGPADLSNDKYEKADRLIPHLKIDRDFNVDEKSHNVTLTDSGVSICEKVLGIDNLYGDMNAEWVHHIAQALSSHNLYKKDVDYIVKEGEVVIVDENTGRLMEGRRYSDGLHQALEAKEHLTVKRENQTLATITFQNFFRMYHKLAGMTGTAATEATEFEKIYNLGVAVIPTHKPCVRDDKHDLIYKTDREKYDAILADIKNRHEKGQPLLVGTISIEKSEHLAQLLKRNGIKHDVLNAKNHGREAEIIKFAGHKGRVTIATNMAGRGTDISLGDGVKELGGLHVLATERHESRRIDNQLRGRSGRQGDPGSSRYYLSLDDDLMRIFGGDRIKSIMDRLGAEEGEVITHSFVNKAIANAQKRVEGQHFESRKNILQYDDVMNEQRRVIYALRRRILEGVDLKEEIHDRMEEAIDIKVAQFIDPSTFQEEWDLESLTQELRRSFGVEYEIPSDRSGLTADSILDDVIEKAKTRYGRLEGLVPVEQIRNLERQVLLITIDQHWKEHLYSMDHLRDAIRFHGYAQKDPLMIYKKEGFALFETCLENISSVVIQRLLNVRVDTGERQVPQHRPTPVQRQIENRDEIKEAPTRGPTAQNPPVKSKPSPVNQGPKLGRNDVCWCGSGKKFKKCHGV
jgi:preprotein translocase subunit SecA